MARKVTLTVHTQNGESKTEGEHGATLLALLAQAGAAVSASCGGEGRCGKCRVRARGGLSAPDTREQAQLELAGAGKEERLACRARVTGDCEVWLPEDEAAVETSWAGPETAPQLNVHTGRARLTRPTLQNPIDDRQNLLAATGAREADFSALNALTGLRAQGADEVCFVETHGRVIDVAPTRPALLGLAVDIGTTTLALRFYDLETGTLLGVESGLNPQRTFGADIISRIAACQSRPRGLSEQQAAVTGALNGQIAAFCHKTGARAENIYSVVLAGNTTMLHLFAGLSPQGIAAAPFAPCSLFGGTITARQAELAVCPGAEVYLAPCVSAYIGGDITAGLLSCGLDTAPSPVLFLDIGTNGEMVLAAGGRLLCCAAAAGPAFEGAHIGQGTGGVTGAICSVRVDENGRVAYETVGGAAPVGLCGSGLLDAAAVMLRLGTMDETGRILAAEEAPAATRPYLLEKSGERCFRVGEDSGIFLTQKDIRELQLAKAAIAAGVGCLLDAAGVKPGEVAAVLLAGGFGARLSPRSACEIGLLPGTFAGKIRSVGNAACAGAAAALLSAPARERLEALRDACETLELSGLPLFQQLFMENMGF